MIEQRQTGKSISNWSQLQQSTAKLTGSSGSPSLSESRRYSSNKLLSASSRRTRECQRSSSCKSDLRFRSLPLLAPRFCLPDLLQEQTYTSGRRAKPCDDGFRARRPSVSNNTRASTANLKRNSTRASVVACAHAGKAHCKNILAINSHNTADLRLSSLRQLHTSSCEISEMPSKGP